MKFIIALLLVFLISCSDNFCKSEDIGLTKSFEIINLIKIKDYNTIKSSFIPQVERTIQLETFTKYIDQCAELIERFGIPEKKDVSRRIMTINLGDNDIIDKTNTFIFYYDFPFPVSNITGKPAEKMISIGFFKELDYQKIVALKLTDNTIKSKILPSFSRLENFDFNINKISHFRIHYTPGNVKKENKKTVTGNFDDLYKNHKLFEQCDSILSLLNNTKITKFDTITEMPRQNGKPEMLIFQLSFDPNYMAPPQTLKEPHLMFILIIKEEEGIPEGNIDTIELMQYKSINNGYSYRFDRKKNEELYKKIVRLKELIQ